MPSPQFEQIKTGITIIGGIGSIIAVSKTASDLLQGRSLSSKRNQQLAKVAQISELATKIEKAPLQEEQRHLFQRHIESSLHQCVVRIQEIDKKLEKLSDDPVRQLKPFVIV